MPAGIYGYLSNIFQNGATPKVWRRPGSALQASTIFLNLTLTPQLLPGNSSLEIHVSTIVPPMEYGAHIMSMPYVIDNTPTANYSWDNRVLGWDESGYLPIWYLDHNDTVPPRREWYLARPSDGHLELEFTAPTADHSCTGIGSLIDLREDTSGLMGNFRSILPILEPLRAETSLSISAFWNISSTSKNITAAWTWGHGLRTEYVGSMDSAISATFAVGPHLQHRNTDITLPNGNEVNFAIYWMGDAPFDSSLLFSGPSTIFSSIAAFFNDTEPFYKLFIRQSTEASFGGSAFPRSMMIDWYEGTRHDYNDVVFLLARGIAHNWLRLDFCKPDAIDTSSSQIRLIPSQTAQYPCSNTTKWFNEGVATYYGSAFTPYDLGIVNATVFLAHLNGLAQAYYTSPAINMSNDDAAKHPWSSFDIIRIPSLRGFMYLLSVDAEIRTATSNRQSLDNVVLALHRRRRQTKDQPIAAAASLDVFLELVAETGVVNTTTKYNAMASGAELQVPARDSLLQKYNLTLQRFDMPMFELGIEYESLAVDENERILTVTHVLKDSRAHDAGLRVGIQVQRKGLGDLNWVADRLERNLSLSVRPEGSDGEWKQIEYWPRSKGLVRGYRWIYGV